MSPVLLACLDSSRLENDRIVGERGQRTQAIAAAERAIVRDDDVHDV